MDSKLVGYFAQIHLLSKPVGRCITCCCCWDKDGLFCHQSEGYGPPSSSISLESIKSLFLARHSRFGDKPQRYVRFCAYWSVLDKLWEWPLYSLIRYNLLEVPGHHKPHKFYSDIVDFHIHWHHFRQFFTLTFTTSTDFCFSHHSSKPCDWIGTCKVMVQPPRHCSEKELRNPVPGRW